MARTLHSAARYAAAVTNVLPRGGSARPAPPAARVGGPARLRRRLAALGDDVPRRRDRRRAGLRRPRRGDAAQGRDPAARRAARARRRRRAAASARARAAARARARPARRRADARDGVRRRGRPAGVSRGRVRVHLVRDGRDVVCSLLERGWLSADRGGGDDAGLAYGARARFWVEPERRAEFEAASDATRAAWAWRTYVTAARRVESRAAGAALRVARRRARTAQRRDSPSTSASTPAVFAGSLDRAHDRSVGRFRRDLTRGAARRRRARGRAAAAELGYDA